MWFQKETTRQHLRSTVCSVYIFLLIITQVRFEPKIKDTITFLREKEKDTNTFYHGLQDI